MTISTKKSPQGTKPPKPARNMEVLELYSPLKVGKIVATSTKKKIDVFDSFRPNMGECLNYNISETCMKLDVGPTKINVKETKATYTPLPPDMMMPVKSRKHIGGFSHGGPPLDKYADDVWKEKQIILQERYRKELEQFIIRRKRRDRLEGREWHNIMQSLVGPAWYQELSPKQLNTVDQLKGCIWQDYKDNTIINTQENIGSLGLVLRPNHRHIKMALKFCCKCPVEFLLILYQLIDPNRSKYTLNDRLLLSAVVHLTMRQTLREMHIRIPSPPAREKVRAKPPRKEKPLKYESPYLVPYSFEPVPRKYTGIYVNKHVQYPESPYFDYRNELYFEKRIAEDIFEVDFATLDPDEVEIMEDLKQAQTAFNSFQNDTTIKLVRPTKTKTSSDFDTFFSGLTRKNSVKQEVELDLPPLATLPNSDDGEECECDQLLEDSDICCIHDPVNPCEECKEKCECRKKSKLYNKCRKCLAKERKTRIKRIIGGIKRTPSDNIIPIIQGTIVPKDCECLQMYKDKIAAVAEGNKLQCQKAKFIIGGVVLTKIGPVYMLSTVYTRNIENDIKFEENEVNSKAIRRSMTEEDSCCKSKERSVAQECTCGYCDTKDENSNRQVIPYFNCRCKKEPDNCLSQQFTCGRGQHQTQKKYGSKHAEGDCCENELLEPCDCEGICDCKEQSKLYTSPKCPRCLAKEKLKNVQRIIGGLKRSRKNKYVPIIEGTRMLQECDCLHKYKQKLIAVAARNKIKCHKAKFIIGGVVVTSKGPVYIISTAFINKPPRNIDPCDTCCKTKQRSGNDDKECICETCDQDDDSSDEEIIKYSACRCKEELDKFLSHKCACEDCLVEARQQYATHIIAGKKYTESGTAINILEGIHDQRCDCLSKHLEKIRKLEDYRKRIEARYQLRKQDLKYSIGGVVNTANGPVYVISGIRPPVECDCAKEMRRKAEEELNLSRMAKMPPTGRIKYQISGVAQTPDGNVYIVSQALAIDDCDCVRLYNIFKEAHTSCLESYEQYLTQIQEEIECFEVEAAETYRRPDEEEDDDTDLNMNIDFDDLNEETEVVDEVEEPDLDVQEATQSIVSQEKTAEICDCLNKLDRSKSSTSTDTSSSSSVKPPCTCTCTTPESSSDDEEGNETDQEDEAKKDNEKDKKLSKKSDKKRGKKLVKKRGKRGNKKGGKKDDKDVKKAREKVEEYESKRFYITTKIPCNEKKQMEIIKKILTGLADDGYPLAKLPNSYKLPHFKLWMQLRCGKFWRQRDRLHYENLSKMGYFHVDHCYNEPPSAKLDISKEKANQMTWRDAAYCRKIVSEKIGMFYRLARQETVLTGREFFPLTFSYEFPTPAFRDCYFAYEPTKEEEVLVYRIIKPYDARVNLKKFPCYC